MVSLKGVVAKANSRLTIKLAASLLAASTLISSLLGLYRDRLLNSLYMPNAVTGSPGYKVGIDAYTIAFTIPDFLFFILVSGALSVTFIPVFNQRLASGNKKSAWEISTSMINLMALITLAASVFIMVFADPLVRYVVGPGLDESGRALAISMMRVLAVSPFLFAISTVIASMQQAVGRFAFYALAPTIYNIGIIIGALFFAGGISIFGVQIFEGGIMGVALGVVLGAIMQLIVSSIGLIGFGFDYHFKIYGRNKGFRKVLSLLPARSLDQGIDYLNNIVEMNLASRMASGTARLYNQVLTLHMVPINLIGVAISTAAFPKMTERLSQGRPDLFRSELQSVLRVIIWLALPVSVITFFARGYLVSFLFNGGNALAANLLGVMVVAILFRTIYHIAARSFYAQQDTKTPLYISLVSISLNIALAVWMTMHLNMGPYGLALAQSIVAFVEVMILFAVMSRRIPKLFDAVFIHAIARMVSATGFMAIVSYFSVATLQLAITDQSFLATFPKFALITIISFGAYLWFSSILKLEEPRPVIKTMSKLLFGRVR